LNIKIRPWVTEARIRIKRVGGIPPTSLIINAYLVMSGLILIFKMYDLVILFIIWIFKISYIFFFICIFHSMRMNLRAMILRGSAGRICHLVNVKSYMSYLQQYTKIIKMLTLKTYLVIFDQNWSVHEAK
jgi:hypothetical protein